MPVLAGSNADEGSTFFGPQLDAEIFKDMVQQKYGKNAGAFLNLYPHQTDKEAINSFNKGWRDKMPWGAHTLTRIHASQTSSKAWLYYFSKVPPGRNSTRYGAFHSSEIVYVFNSFKAVDRPWSSQDKKLAEQILSYWINFATSGNPNGKGLPTWPVYAPQSRKVLELSDTIQSRSILQDEIVEFYNHRLKEQRNP